MTRLVRPVLGILAAAALAVPACSRPATNGPRIAETVTWPATSGGLPLDAAVEGRVSALLAQMTVEDEVGQVIQANSTNITPDEVRRYRPGSILSGGDSGPGGRSYASGDAWLAANDAFWDAAMAPKEGAPPIPPLFGIDAVHGHAKVIGATVFPHNVGLGAMRDLALVHEIAEVTARELSVTGHDWTFAPTLAVARDERWGRSYESFSESPDLVASYARGLVAGLQGEPGGPELFAPGRVVATAKHFVGDGGTVDGHDQGESLVSEQELRDVHAAGYPPSIDAGVQTIMASFSSWRGEKMHGSRYFLTTVLKGRLGFNGFVVGDWNGHGQVPGCTNESCAAALNAGLDMFMAPDSWKGLFAATLAQVRGGVIPRERLDDAVRRILRVKVRAGLFEKGRPSSRPLAGRLELLGSPEHRAVARAAARESLVLLKNEEGLLPLERHARVLVAGDAATSIARQCGGWTLSWQGGAFGNELFPNGQTIFDGIREAVEGAGGSAVLSPDGSFVTKPDVAIVVFGERPYAEFQGDLETVAFEADGTGALPVLERLRGAGVAVVSVFLSGRPLWVSAEINASDAFVAAFLPGTEGGAVADVLFRDGAGGVAHDFGGTLSFSWPRTPTQVPVNVGDPGYDPLFAYGYGLRYGDHVHVPALAVQREPRHARTRSPSVFVASGAVASPWRLYLASKGRAVEAADGGAALHGVASLSRASRRAPADAWLVSWSGSAEASVYLFADDAVDFRRQSNASLELAVDVFVREAPTAPVHLAMRCGRDAGSCNRSVRLDRWLARLPRERWTTARVSLRCFESGGDLSSIRVPFELATAGRGELLISDVRLEPDANGVVDCP